MCVCVSTNLKSTWYPSLKLFMITWNIFYLTNLDKALRLSGRPWCVQVQQNPHVLELQVLWTSNRVAVEWRSPPRKDFTTPGIILLFNFKEPERVIPYHDGGMRGREREKSPVTFILRRHGDREQLGVQGLTQGRCCWPLTSLRTLGWLRTPPGPIDSINNGVAVNDGVVATSCGRHIVRSPHRAVATSCHTRLLRAAPLCWRS